MVRIVENPANGFREEVNGSAISALSERLRSGVEAGERYKVGAWGTGKYSSGAVSTKQKFIT